VRDANVTSERGGAEFAAKIVEIALGAAALERAPRNGADPGAVVAAIFEPAQPFEQARRDCFAPYNGDNSAHQF
jgi:hypothetical protein